VFTEYQGHGTELARKAHYDGYTRIIAVGGDGTVNEVATALVGTKGVLGILPIGSGNGLARHLGIYNSLETGISLLFTRPVRRIDAGKINGKYFFCTAGLGFEAEVAHRFAKATQRGFTRYLKIVLQTLNQFKPERIWVETEIGNRVIDAFSSTFANASQFGNNAWIAPAASVSDGLIDMVTIQRFSMLQAPFFAWKLMNRKLKPSQFYHTERARKFLVRRSTEGFIHLDGEPLHAGKEFTVEVQPACLNIIF
jgi:YegS/Rv2252/BmrU family lipid kinase